MSSSALPARTDPPDRARPPDLAASRRPHLRAVETGLPHESVRPPAHDSDLPMGCPPLARRTIGTIAVFAFEAVEGTRHVGQLGRWISLSVAQELAELRALTLERRSLYRDARRLVPHVRVVRASTSLPGVVEATVVLDISGRCRAVAIRFEVVRGRWQATSVTIL